MVGVSSESRKNIILIIHLVDCEIYKALLAEVGSGDGLVEVTVNNHGIAIGSAHTALETILHNHHATPAGVTIVVENVRIGILILSSEHPRSVGAVEAVVLVQVFSLAHHCITSESQLSILLSIFPVALLEVSSGLQTIDHGEVGSIDIFTSVVGKQLLSSIKVIEDELESLVPSHTGIVAALVNSCCLGNLNSCGSIGVLIVWLVSVHSYEI